MPDVAVRESPETASPQSSGANRLWLAVGLALTVIGAIMLATVFRFGASWPVVGAVTVGTTVSAFVGGATYRGAIVFTLVVTLVGLAWIETIDVVQYGTLSLVGTPPMVTWCGNTYRPNGSTVGALSRDDGPPWVQMLTTPSGFAVFGTYTGQVGQSCGATGPLYVQTWSGVYATYNP